MWYLCLLICTLAPQNWFTLTVDDVHFYLWDHPKTTTKKLKNFFAAYFTLKYLVVSLCHQYYLSSRLHHMANLWTHQNILHFLI